MSHLLLPLGRRSGGQGEALFGHHPRAACHGQGHVAQPGGRLGQHPLAVVVVGCRLACRHIAAGAFAATVVGGGGHFSRVLRVLHALHSSRVRRELLGLRLRSGALLAQGPHRIPHALGRLGQRPAGLAGWGGLPQPDAAGANADQRDLQSVPADQFAYLRLQLRLRQRPRRAGPDTGVVSAGAKLANG